MTTDPAGSPASTGDDGPLAGAELTLQVGERIACFRNERGLKVAELARRVGVTGSLISQIERGRSRPSISTLFLIGEALDVPIDAFFRDDDDPTARRRCARSSRRPLRRSRRSPPSRSRPFPTPRTAALPTASSCAPGTGCGSRSRAGCSGSA